MVEQSMISVPAGQLGQQVARAKEQAFHMLAGGQHADDDFGALHGGFGIGGDGHAVCGQLVAGAGSERSNARTSWPALCRLCAMGPPMLPRPMNAIFMCCLLWSV